MATEYFVREGGSDGASGDTTHPFLTITHALSVATTPGDIITVDDSRTYTQGSEGTNGADAVIMMTHSGTAGNPITLRASSGHNPIIDTGSVAYAPVDMFADWLTLGPGFILYGRADEVDYNYCQVTNPLDRRCQGGGANMVGTGLTVVGCEAKWNGGYGIGGSPPFPLNGRAFDIIHILNNIVHNNGYWNSQGGSGISLYEPTLGTGSTDGDGYRIRITGNLIYQNLELVPEIPAGNTFADGNGIIIDDSRHDQNSGQGVPYTGRALIADNNIWGCTGGGVHIFGSNHVDVVHNTVFECSQVTFADHGAGNPPSSFGQMGCYGADDVIFVNNIVVAQDGHSYTMYNYNNSTNVYADYNVVWRKDGAPLMGVSGPHDINADPMFVHEAIDYTADLTLQGGSPAIGAAVATFAPMPVPANAAQTTSSSNIGAAPYSLTVPPVVVPTSTALPNRMMVGLGIGVVPAIVYSKWNTADAHSGVDLLFANGDRTVQHANNGTGAFVRSTKSITKGNGVKVHFEFTAAATNFNGGNSAPWIIGLSKAGTTPASFFGDSNDVVAYQNWTSGNGIVYLNATAVYSLAPAQTHAGNTVAFEWDTGANTLSIKVGAGGSWSTPLDVSTMNAGDWCIAYYNSESSDAFTINTGQDAFVITPQSGYVAWDLA